MPDYIAHTDKSSDRIQTVQEHLTQAAVLAGEFARPFHAEAEGFFCGMLHDLGKYTPEFQRHILENAGSPDHSTAGAWEAWQRRDLPAAFCIAGHHGGLPDGGAPDVEAPGTLMGRLANYPQVKQDYSAYSQELTLPNPAAAPPWSMRDNFAAMFYTRMLYSCLTDADFLDTESFMSDSRSGRRSTYPDMQQLLERLEAYVRPWWDARTELNRMRCRILRTCLDAGEQPSGLYTLTVPTGGGKTVASLAFALRHAAVRGKRRIIYVIPFTSIIEQNAAVFRQILDGDCVIEHHSNTEPDGDGPQRLACENWDAPVIVTTAVQFFESLYANRSSQCRKLHNIADSVLIFDEAQMLPIPYLEPCVQAMAELVRNYGCTALLCTATQPALQPIFNRLKTGLHSEELIPDPDVLSRAFRRVAFRQKGTQTTEELAERLAAETQVLCIVNTRKRARELYGMLPAEGSFHLSTLMTPRHRRRVLEEVRRRLKAGLPCRVVSTSLIEAGVDVDFPCVFRELAGLDSILQAAGRCNRENRRDPEKSLVTVFSFDEAPPPLFRQNIAATREALRNGGTPDDPAAIQTYFRFLHQLKEAELDEHQILDQIQRGIGDIQLPFATLAREVKLIGTDTRAVYIPNEHNAELLNTLRSGAVSRELFRALGRDAVNIYPQHFAALADAGALERIGDAAILRDPSLYDENAGLSLQSDAGRGLYV